MTCDLSDIPTLSSLECVFKVVISNLLAVGGIIFFVMLLTGGYQYLTSGGSPDSVARAQNTLTYAIIGLVAAMLSYMILLLIEYVTGAEVTDFKFSTG